MQMDSRFFLAMCKAFKLPEPTAEVRFHPTRRWRFDWAWESSRVALEINGGVWTGGRHSRGSGQIGDMEKLNEAQIAGWQVFQVTPKQVKSGEAFEVIKRALEARNHAGEKV
jgi:hypothetical protein